MDFPKPTEPGEGETVPAEYAFLHIEDLHPSATETDLHEVFRDYGEILSILVLRDPQTHRSLGRAKVSLSSPKVGLEIIQNLNFVSVRGRAIRIMPSRTAFAPKPPREANLFVRCIHPDVTPRQFNDTFVPYGEIVRSKLLTNDHGKSLCYGFVQFLRVEDAEKAIAALNETEVIAEEGGKLSVSRFMSRQQRIDQGLIDDPNDVYTIVFLNNFTEPTTEDDIRALCEDCGDIENISIPQRDPDAVPDGKQPRVRVFVHFTTHEGAVACVTKLNGMMIAGQKIVATRALSKAERSTMTTTAKPHKQRSHSHHAPKPVPHIIPPRPFTLVVRGLPEYIDDMGLASMFSDFGTVISAHVMIDTTTHKSRGFGFVTMQNEHQGVDAIMNLDQYRMGNRVLHVSEYVPRDDRKGPVYPGDKQPPMFFTHVPHPPMGQPWNFGPHRGDMPPPHGQYKPGAMDGMGFFPNGMFYPPHSFGSMPGFYASAPPHPMQHFNWRNRSLPPQNRGPVQRPPPRDKGQQPPGGRQLTIVRPSRGKAAAAPQPESNVADRERLGNLIYGAAMKTLKDADVCSKVTGIILKAKTTEELDQIVLNSEELNDLISTAHEALVHHQSECQ